MDQNQILLCGDCKKWKPWPCPRINTHRYGTCTEKDITTRRVTFCLMIDRNALDFPHRPLTQRQQQIFDLWEQGLNYKGIAERIGSTPMSVRTTLKDIACKMQGISRKKH